MTSPLLSFLVFIYTVVVFGLSGIPGVSRLSLISAIIMAALLIIRRKPLIVPPWIVLIGLLYFYLIIPGMAASEPGWEMIAGATTVLFGTICVGLALSNHLVSPNIIIYAMTVAVVLNIIAILLGVDTTPTDYQLKEANRFSGLLGNSNALAINFSLSAIAAWIFAPKVAKSLKWLLCFTTMYGVYISGSRKGVLLVAALFLIVSNIVSNNVSHAKKISLYLILCSSFLAVYMLWDTIELLGDKVVAITRFNQMFTGDDTSFNERKRLIDIGYKIWLDSPIFGEGLGQFSLISGFGAYSHNNYIELLVSGGIISFVIYYSLYFIIIYNAYNYRRDEFHFAVISIFSLIVIDTAAVSFVGRPTMLFVVFSLSHYYANYQQQNSISR